jgi:collagen type IV alpha-3-binding protein
MHIFNDIMGSNPGSVGDSNNGENSLMVDDEFFEVSDAEIDIEIEQHKHKMIPTSRTHVEDTAGNLIPRFLPSSHPIYADVCRVVDEHMRFSQFENTIWGDSSNGASESSDSKANVWQLFFQEGNIRMYRRELEREGRVIDPLKAVHVVKGITGRELLKHFYELQYRMEWEFTLDLPPVLLDKISNDTMVIYQLFKRIWPADQRDGVFWSHIRRTSDWVQPPTTSTTSDTTTPAKWFCKLKLKPRRLLY